MSELKIFTLKQVVSSIRKTIEDRYQQLYWVKAEMHKLNRYPSGHCFPELLQKEDGKIVAEMRGTIWGHQFERINKRFIEVVKEPLKEDTTLLMQVKVTFHETYGLSLQIKDIDPQYALGELKREREATIKQLKKEGLLNKNQLLDFPLLPKRIAVISAEASKGLSDFYKVIENNTWGYQFFTMLFPAYLQGDLATDSISNQLNAIKRVVHHFDAVVIVRGGGGEIGLSCYNNYKLCKEIAEFPLPVLTGIGHSTNLTVAEIISYRNAITPTELGEFLIQAFHNFSVPIKESIRIIQSKVVSQFNLEKLKLKQCSQNITGVTKSFVASSNNKLTSSAFQLQQSVRSSISGKHRLLDERVYQLKSTKEMLLQSHRSELTAIHDSISKGTNKSFKEHENALEKMEQFIRLTDPINVLKRGYTITTLRGKSISQANQAVEGDEITTRTATFELVSTVKKTKKS